jgi:hypothetical protein
MLVAALGAGGSIVAEDKFFKLRLAPGTFVFINGHGTTTFFTDKTKTTVCARAFIPAKDRVFPDKASGRPHFQKENNQ